MRITMLHFTLPLTRATKPDV